MSGSKSGGIKLRQTMIAKYGSEDAWRASMRAKASVGGQNGSGFGYRGGFASKGECNCSLIAGEHQYQRCAGKRGGTISRRGPAGPIEGEQA